MNEFFQRLRQRKLVQWGIAYGAAAFALLQGIDIVAQQFDWPEGVRRGITLALVLGLFVTLVLAWFHGERGAQRVSGTELTILAFLLAVGGVVLWQLAKAPGAKPGTVAAAPSPAALSAPEKSIAVLPFVNMSADKGDEYLSDGVSDELIAALARITGLQVKARTSSFAFKGRNEDIQKIGELLRVSYLLEGSVARAGNKLRITAQLIRAADGNHLWSNIYDREMQDIFAVRSEVARQVAETLKIHLLGETKRQLEKQPTQNLEAHELYLKGRYFWNQRTGDDLRRALGYFQQAIEKDPSYALAHAGAADCYSILPLYSDTPAREDFARAKAAGRRAVELDDSLAETHTALANALGADLQLAAAEVEFKRAFALDPNYASAHQWYGECLQSLGRFDEAVAELKKARELDPLSLIINTILAGVFYSAGRSDEAWEQIQRTIELDPDFAVAYWVRGQILESRGELDRAIADYEKSKTLGQNDAADALIACVYARSGKEAQAREILNRLLEKSRSSFVSSYPLAQIHAMLGDEDEAVRLLEQAYEERSIPVGGGGVGGPRIDHRFDSLRNNPRFQKLLATFVGETS